MKVKPTQLKCLRPDCGHIWTPRGDEVNQCPKCRGFKFEEVKEDRLESASE